MVGRFTILAGFRLMGKAERRSACGCAKLRTWKTAGSCITWRRRSSGSRRAKVHGSIDPERRRDHMQQHTGQHVLSAAFIELYQMPTVSFHMGEDYCSIDLAIAAVSAAQMVGRRSGRMRLFLRIVR